MEASASAPAPEPVGTPEVSVIAPTFNEAENLPLLVERLHAALKGWEWELIVADDDSPDHTWEVAEKLASTDPRVHVMRRFHDHGLSAAVLDGMSIARGDVLVVMDADLQHDETILPSLVERVRTGEADICVGSRSTDGGDFGEWSKRRRLVSWVATMIAKGALRVPVTDPMSGYFAVSRHAYEATAPAINPQGFKILLEFLGRNRSLRVAEVGYTFRNRVHGETKLSRSVIRSYLLAVAELRIGRAVNPYLLLYCMVGAFGVLVGNVAYTVGAWLGLPEWNTGLLGGFDPIETSFLFAIAASVTSNFILNNEFTFWERRYRGWKLAAGFALFCAVSAIGVVINLGVLETLSGNDVGEDLLGPGLSRQLHVVAGGLLALVSNWFLNTNYTWRRRD